MGRTIQAVLSRIDRMLGAMETNLLAVYGGAQVDPQEMGTQAERSADRLDGVAAGFEVRRDSAGHAYLVRSDPDGRAGSR